MSRDEGKRASKERERDREDDDEDEDEDEEEGQSPIDNDQLATILSGVKALAFVPWPANPEIQIPLRPLSREEVLRGAASAKRYVTSLDLQDVIVTEVDEGNGRTSKITWLDMVMRDEWLSIALRRPENDGQRPLFSSASDLRSKLTTDEIDRLYELLSEHMIRVMPMTMAEQMGQKEEWLRLVEALKKKPSETSLVGLPPAMLRELIYFMINLLPDSLLNKSSISTS